MGTRIMVEDTTVPFDDRGFLEFTKNRKRSTILMRIEDYLTNGGLFNPEYMDSEQVRLLILDMREYLTVYEKY